MTDSVVNLLPNQVLEDRPFTHPGALDGDRAVLGGIVECLRGKLRPPSQLPAQPRPLVMYEKVARGRKRRIVICDSDQLLADHPITVVGFFGQKRPGVDRTPLDLIDEELIAGFPQFPGVLGYCSDQRPGGNWANLVLLRDPSDLDHWSASPRHAFAAKALAPDYYLNIRLHNAVLEGGVLSGRPIVFQRTKYYDFEEIPPWRGVRDLFQR